MSVLTCSSIFFIELNTFALWKWATSITRMSAASLKDVLYRHESLQSAFFIDEGELLHSMLVKNLLRSVNVGVCGSSDDLLRHHIASEKIRICKTDVSSCQNADEMFPLNYRQS